MVSPSRDFMDGTPDEQLVRRVLAGDSWASEALFRRHGPSILRLATHSVGSSEDANDIVQDTFAEIFESLGRLREHGAFRAWIFKIAVNRCRKLLRRRRIARVFGLDHTVEDERLAECAAPSASPEAVAELRRIDAVLGTVSADSRVAWTLRRVQGESPEQIAQFLGVSLATAKRRIADAQKAIDLHLNRNAP